MGHLRVIGNGVWMVGSLDRHSYLGTKPSMSVVTLCMQTPQKQMGSLGVFHTLVGGFTPFETYKSKLEIFPK